MHNVAKAKPPLSNCDHNTVHLIPTYKTLLKSAKPHTKTISVWSEDSIETLKGCFDSTDWDLFHEMDIETATESITDYINFCVDSIVEKKTVTVFPNSKSFITKEVKECLNRKKLAFINHDKIKLKIVQKELNILLKGARKKYRDTREDNFATGNSKKLWDAMKVVTNMAPPHKTFITNDDETKGK